MEISAKLVKELRDRTGVGFMECKKALQETNGDVDAAEIVLRKRGVSVAAKKAGREANEGLIEAYIHPGAKLGVLLELNCESDFVARTEDFQGLARDIAMHVAATSPRFVRREEVDEAAIAQEKRSSAIAPSRRASPRRSWTRSSKAA
jgi:elongation factor Ts